ncbi:diguanylate cyclase (GGDEF) domain-containing protein [Ectothiorhodospira mobilis]|uniref:diguanylate cyclase n=2 Tax=Ectothiorhodospira mobilis TaxID=195064 RepID=A0A1I4RWH5_ECTMO|nr:diguanylate cyclase (GGDEF) domain-containing protein [Ectothiorhodospira mobilis]
MIPPAPRAETTMNEPDLFASERAALARARRVLAKEDAAGHRDALQGLADAYERLVRDMDRLIRHADRTERELARANQQLRELTETLAFRNRHDGLTGLLNRETLIQEAEGILQERPLGLILVDLDFFKQINDRYGHPVGDRVLVDVARALERSRPEEGYCGRLGGEEFALVLGAACGRMAAQVADELAGEIRAIRRPEAPGLRVTASMGVAVAVPGVAFDRVYLCADDALYRAKYGGRDRIERVRDQIEPEGEPPPCHG